MRSIGLLAAVLSVAVLGFAGLAQSQEGPGGLLNPGRDCHTITTCNYKRHGSYRGCVSSYSCRVCSFRPAKCSIVGAPGKVCEKLVCRWGA
jgi:hypothetical protein